MKVKELQVSTSRASNRLKSDDFFKTFCNFFFLAVIKVWRRQRACSSGRSGRERRPASAALTRSPSGRLLFPPRHFPLQLLWLVVVVVIVVVVLEWRIAAAARWKSECGLRHTAAARARLCVCVCASLYFGSRSSSVSLTAFKKKP